MTNTPSQWQTQSNDLTLRTVESPAMNTTPAPAAATDIRPPIARVSHTTREVQKLRAKLNVTKRENKRLREEIESKDQQLSMALGEISIAARVFAIPELLEQILLSLELHDTQPFRISSLTNAIHLCRLQRVNRHFHDTITSSKKLLKSRTLLRLENTPTKLVALTWLLRELGYKNFDVANCETFGCYRSEGFWHAQGGCVHVCGYGGLTVNYSPGASLAVDYKGRFEEATTVDEAWRHLKIPRSLTIFFRGRSPTYCRVESNQPTLGLMWDQLKDLL